ncbi:uncharacterized protein UV8b_05968 [Ustilaginoidea virens]|uniref:Uncharacterized protein n=1 Tax=Ustilaginoidea virens TaxID=1159556 RepID=A0A8E5HU96_USTVR|nr:uncharacterized protein UV8b_05968 [Ustilaginoidea virens]QUC21725.1 hypothetical protein UV8b_05968 [Ustilaginoidea virens]
MSVGEAGAPSELDMIKVYIKLSIDTVFPAGRAIAEPTHPRPRARRTSGESLGYPANRLARCDMGESASRAETSCADHASQACFGRGRE